ELGRGAMGVVYEARQLSLDRNVAIKVIVGYGSLSRELRERFDREIAMLAGISHPNIVKTFGSGVFAGTPYVVMELIRGEPLTSLLLPKGEALTTDRVHRIVEIAAKLARALDHAHERGVVHRDVKPGNVLVDSRGEPVLIDFGLA